MGHFDKDNMPDHITDEVPYETPIEADFEYSMEMESEADYKRYLKAEEKANPMIPNDLMADYQDAAMSSQFYYNSYHVRRIIERVGQAETQLKYLKQCLLSLSSSGQSIPVTSEAISEFSKKFGLHFRAIEEAIEKPLIERSTLERVIVDDVELRTQLTAFKKLVAETKEQK